MERRLKKAGELPLPVNIPGARSCALPHAIRLTEAMESPEAEVRDCVHRAYDLLPANPYINPSFHGT